MTAAHRALDALYTAAGTSAIYQTCPLERAHRDFRVMLQHIVAQPLWLEESGRIAMGLNPVNPQYAF